jgi:hypothetical protein
LIFELFERHFGRRGQFHILLGTKLSLEVS